MKSILFTSALISVALMLGRLSGFVREMLIASRFGVTETADVVVLMLTLPDFLIGFLMVGGMNAALVPAMKKAAPADRAALLWRSLIYGFLIAFLLAAGLALAPQAITGLMAASLDPARLEDIKLAFSVSLMAIPISAMIGVTTAYLNVIDKFTIPSLSVLLFNGTIIAYVAAAGSFSGSALVMGFALAVAAGAALRLAFQAAAIPGILRSFSWTLSEPQTGLIGRFVLGVAGYSVIVGAPIFFRSLYAAQGSGALAVFNYAQKLFELPAAILIAPVAIVLLPKLSGLDGKDDQKFRALTTGGLAALIGLALAATFSVLIFADTFVRVIYQRGQIDAASAAHIAGLARYLIVALPFYGIIQLCAAGLNAQHRPGAVARGTVFGLACSAVAMAAASGLLGESRYVELGYLVFHIAGAGYVVSAFFGPAALRFEFWKPVIVMSSISTAIAVATRFAHSMLSPMPLWQDVTALLVSGFILLAVCVPFARALYSDGNDV